MHSVNKEINIDIINKVEFLNGYLNALSSVDGKIGQFFSRVDFFCSTEEELFEDIKKKFGSQVSFKFTNKERIDKNPMKIFELALRSFILSGTNEDIVESKVLSDKRRYISFKIMDMIDFLNLDGFPFLVIIDVDSDAIDSKFYALFFDNDCLLFLFERNY